MWLTLRFCITARHRRPIALSHSFVSTASVSFRHDILYVTHLSITYVIKPGTPQCDAYNQSVRQSIHGVVYTSIQVLLYRPPWSITRHVIIMANCRWPHGSVIGYSKENLKIHTGSHSLPPSFLPLLTRSPLFPPLSFLPFPPALSLEVKVSLNADRGGAL